MGFHALAEFLKNVSIKIVAKGGAGAAAFLGGSTVAGLTIGYLSHEYFKHKTRLAELDYQRIIATLENSEHNGHHDDNDGNDDGPTPIAA